MKTYIKAYFIIFIYRLLLLSWKFRFHECEELKALIKEKKPFILAHWHGDELALLYLVKKYKLSTMVSHSKDGALMNLAYQNLGGKTTRGSSSRGGVGALKGLIKLMRLGHSTSVAVDGPRGPIHKVKPGIFELSRLSKAPIFTIGVSCKSYFQSKRSWNKAILPKPFTRIQVVILFHQNHIEKSENPRAPELAKHLEDQLFNARRQASKLIDTL